MKIQNSSQSSTSVLTETVQKLVKGHQMGLTSADIAEHLAKHAARPGLPDQAARSQVGAVPRPKFPVSLNISRCSSGDRGTKKTTIADEKQIRFSFSLSS